MGAMIFRARQRALYLWIALLAMLFSALAPTVSHAIAASSPADALAMCSVNDGPLSGMDKDKAPASLKHGMEHCAFCTVHSGGDALPTLPAVVLVLDRGRDVYPSLFYTAPQPLHAWSAAHPRAPPFLA